MISVNQVTVEFGGFTLLDDISFVVNDKDRIALVGKNGAGKSTMLKIFAGLQNPSKGSVSVPKETTIGYLPQHMIHNDNCTVMQEAEKAFSHVSDLQAKIDKLGAELAERTDYESDSYHLLIDRLTEANEKLAILGGGNYIGEIERTLCGLGFTREDFNRQTSEFSGGWRMRIALAQALFLQPELLILDEPTNHLDLQAVIWLEAYLMKWKKTLLLVTHDASFLSNTCDHIIHYHNFTLTQYRGDYWQFLKAREVHLAGLKKKLDKQDKTAAKMKELKQRQKSGKNVAGAKSKIEKFESGEKVEMEVEEAVPKIMFPEPGPLGLPVLQFQDVTFGYDPAKPLFKHLEFGVYMDSRIGLVGPNGAGKTTLIKLMSGDLKENSGNVARNTHLVMARFAQHHIDQLNMDMTPLEYMQSKFGDAQTQDVRQFLGRFGLRGGMALQRIGTLSGGQRSRLVFAEICWRSPHILLLDEPTNHLDMDTIEALIDGIREFKGGVVLISHHQRLIEAACNEVWIVREGEIERFDGDFEDYKKSVLRSMPPVDDE